MIKDEECHGHLSIEGGYPKFTARSSIVASIADSRTRLRDGCRDGFAPPDLITPDSLSLVESGKTLGSNINIPNFNIHMLVNLNCLHYQPSSLTGRQS